jgi:acetyl-CoA carboxylase biotin carboxyl carrier protein
VTPETSEEIVAILKLIDNSSYEEVRLEIGELKLHVRRAAAKQTPEPAAVGHTSRGRGAPSGSASAAPAAQPSGLPAGQAEQVPGTPVAAPMVGTFYRAPSPAASPFVELGDTVGVDTVVCIVEAMKVMNTVKAGAAGTIVEIAVENGALVEYGQRLFTVAPATT